MESIFTAFLTSNNNCSLKNNCCMEKYILQNSSLAKTPPELSPELSTNMAIKKEVVTLNQSVKSIKKDLSVHKNIFIHGMEMLYNMYQKIKTNLKKVLNKEEPYYSPFYAYFEHQVYHLASRRRFGILPFTSFCCCFGVKNNTHHIMISSLDNCCEYLLRKNLLDTECLCAIHYDQDRFCQRHSLFINKLDFSKDFCSWKISFTELEEDSSKVFFSNPCYDMPCETNIMSDMSVDQIEIEFDNFDFQLKFKCEGFSDESSESSDESILYESDDDDDEICFQSYEFEISASGNAFKACTIQQQITPLQKSATKKSGYHTDCTVQKDITNGSSRRRVHFSDEVQVKQLCHWTFAYNNARKTTWVKVANDRAHFRQKIQHLSVIIDPVLKRKLMSLKCSI